jgi:hypothetical protein
MSEFRRPTAFAHRSTSVQREEVVPVWAESVRRSRSADAFTDTVEPANRISALVDAATGLKYWEAPELFSVVVEALDQVGPACALLGRLRSHPLEVAMLAFPPGMVLAPQLLSALAAEGIGIVREEGASADLRAQKFMEEFLALRLEGLTHFRWSVARDKP